MPTTWRPWEPAIAKLQRDRAQWETMQQTVLNAAAKGGIHAAAAAVAPPEPPKQQGGGGLLGSIASAAGDFVGGYRDTATDWRDALTGGSVSSRLGDLADAGSGLTRQAGGLLSDIGGISSDVGHHISGPVFSSFLDQQGGIDTDPLQVLGNLARAASMANPVTRLARGVVDQANPYGDQAAGEFDRFQKSNAPVGLKAAANVLGDPGSYIGPGVASKLGPLAGLIEQPIGASVGAGVGSGVAAQAADQLDLPDWAQGLAPMIGAFVGGAAGARPSALKAGAEQAVSPLTGEGVLAGERGSFDMGAIGRIPKVEEPGISGGAGAVSSPVPPATGSGLSLRTLDPTALLSKAYGQLPFVRSKSGIGGLPDWMVDAPDAYDGSSLINLKAITSDPALPVSAKLSNAVWKGLEKVGGDKLSMKLEDPRVRQIRMMHDMNAQAIPAIADTEMAIHTAPVRDLPIGPKGEALDAAGAPVDFINEHGRPEVGKLTPRKVATWDDIMLHPERYPVDQLLTPEQTAAFRAMSERMQAIADTSRAMGIKIEGQVQPSEGGVYLSRIGTKPALREEGPVSQVGKRYEDGKAGSTLERRFKSGADAIDGGMVVPSPAEAFKLYVQKNLEQQNGTHAGNLLKQVVLSDGKTIGASAVDQATKEELVGLRKDLRPQSRELRQLKGAKAIADRDVRLGNAWIQSATTRGQELLAKAQDAGAAVTERQAAASEALALAKQQLADSLSAAADLERKTQSLGRESEASRIALKRVLDEGSALSSRLNAIEDQAAGAMGNVAHGETGGYVNGMAVEAKKATDYAQQVREAAATEAATVQKRLEALPYADVNARHQDALTAAADAHARFSASLSDVKRARVDIQAAAAAEPAAAERARQAMWQGRNDELTKVWRQRASQVLRAVDRSSELGQKIEQLSAQMEPSVQRTKELRAQVQDVRKLAHDRGQVYSGEIPLDSMRGIKVPREMVNAWTKTMASPHGTGAQVFDLVNNSFRMLGATADASRMMTVGLLGNADNPVIGTRASLAGVKTALNEDAMWNHLRSVNAKAVAEGLPPLTEAIGKDGLMLAESEYSLKSAAKPGSFAERFSNLPVIKQADALYTAPGNVERVERYYAQLRRLKAEGKDFTSPQARESAANAANLISGRARNGVLSPIIGADAANRIAFAGRFVQSQLETVANAALSGGIEGYEARKALLRLSIGVAGATFAINQALGNQTVLDAGDPNFLAIRVGGTDYKLGGAYQSLLAGVWKAAHEAGDSFMAKDPAGVLTSPTDLIRGKAGPLAGIGYDLTAGHGKNPIGGPALGLNTLPVPFAVRDIATQAQRTDFGDPTSLGALGLASVASLTGVKANPMTPTEELNQAVGDMFQGKEFNDLSPAQKEQVKAAHPDLWQAKVNAGTAESRQYYKRKDELTAEQAASDAAAASGQLTKAQWLAQYHDRQLKLSEAGHTIFGDTGPKKNPKTAQDFYGNAIDSAKRADGSIDWEQVDSAVAALPQAMQDTIAESHGLGSTPMVRKYKQALALKAQMRALPKYVGYTGAEANDIDAAYAHLPAGGSVSAGAKLRALAQLGIDDPRVIRGVRARILGTIGKQSPARQAFVKRNPLYSEFFGSGNFDPASLDGAA